MLRSTLVVVLVAIFCTPIAMAKEDWNAWRKNTTKYKDGTLTYYVHTPPGYAAAPDKKFPLLVLLHWSYVNGPAYLHYWRPDTDRNDVIVAAPNSRGGASWVAGDGPNIRRMLDQVKKKYRVDESRVWLAGYSAGGVYIYHMLFNYPELFDAVLALGGRIGRHRRSAPSKPGKRSTRVCIFHGKWDRNIKFPIAEADVAKLEKLGYEVAFHIMEKFGHWIPRDRGDEMLSCLNGGKPLNGEAADTDPPEGETPDKGGRAP